MKKQPDYQAVQKLKPDTYFPSLNPSNNIYCKTKQHHIVTIKSRNDIEEKNVTLR